MPPPDQILTLLDLDPDISGRYTALSLDVNNSTIDTASSHNLHTIPREIQRNYINHLNSMQVTSGCTVSGGSENGGTIHSDIKQEVSECLQQASCDDATCGCHDNHIDVKQKMSFFKLDDSGCGSNDTDGCHDNNIDVKQEMSFFKLDNSGCGQMSDADTTQDISDNVSFVMEVKNEKDDITDSLGVVMEVKNEKDSKVWWNQECDTQSHDQDVISDNNHQPKGVASLGSDLSEQKELPLQIQDSSSTECQKRKEGCTFSLRTKPNKRSSSKHLRKYDGEKPYKCSTCDKAFSTSSHLTIHKRTHTAEKPYQCSTCDKAFSTSSYLTIHKRTHTDEKPYQCSTCDKAFSTSSYLTIHKRTHTAEKPYQCSTCDKAFFRSSHLTIHKRTHTGETPYQCSICGKAFSLSCTLTTHKRTHTGEKPYQCSACDKAFSQSSGLIAHKRTHTGEKPYQCSTCDKAFSQSSGLIAHERTHTGEKPYQCSTCGKTFTFLSNLIAHKRTHTGENTVEKPYQCSACSPVSKSYGQSIVSTDTLTILQKYGYI